MHILLTGLKEEVKFSQKPNEGQCRDLAPSQSFCHEKTATIQSRSSVVSGML